VAPSEEVVRRIVAAHAADAASFVLDLPRPQARGVLAALGPREVARLLRGVRADRVAELLDHIAPNQLPAVLAHLGVSEVAEMLTLVPVEMALRVVTQLAPDAAADLLLALPSQHRTVLQALLPPPAAVPTTGGYTDQAEQAVLRAAGRVSGRDPRSGGLLIEVFGRPIEVLIRDRPGGVFGPGDLHATIGATDWRHTAGLIVLTNATRDPGLGAAVREARQYGYVVEVLQWQDERDDGTLKRTLVRMFG
jgi:Mg/Co/Ni transporter MgtE